MANVRAIGQVWRLPVYWPSGNRYLGGMNKEGRGTPQGGVISPLLANLFLHYAFDMWITKLHPGISFERYADDIIVHCHTQQEAEEILRQITMRMDQCRLELHPFKTKIVYCKDHRRKEPHKQVQFDF